MSAVRRIYNVFLVRGDADDVAAHLRRQGLNPKVYRRSVRAEWCGCDMYVIVADAAVEG
jgi:hypothetical protein